MSPSLKDYIVIGTKVFPSGCILLRLKPKDGKGIDHFQPGQFVMVKTECPGVLLRRPISISDYTENDGLTLFVKPIGNGSRYISSRSEGDILNIEGPLGNGFSLINDPQDKRVLLVGGGVGAAPLSGLSRVLSESGSDVTVCIGGRSSLDVEGINLLYPSASRILLTTDDGSAGHHGLVTSHPVFEEDFDMIYCCGPTPMMKAVAKIAKSRQILCEVSLENSMACGIGACLCCVQDTSDQGNVCVCKEGPVFNINRLESWI